MDDTNKGARGNVPSETVVWLGLTSRWNEKYESARRGRDNLKKFGKRSNLNQRGSDHEGGV